MWMVLHHDFRVVQRKGSCTGKISLSECLSPPSKMDWAPMWTVQPWCSKYNPPPSRRPFLYFNLDRLPEAPPVSGHRVVFDYLAYAEANHTLYPPSTTSCLRGSDTSRPSPDEAKTTTPSHQTPRLAQPDRENRRTKDTQRNMESLRRGKIP